MTLDDVISLTDFVESFIAKTRGDDLPDFVPCDAEIVRSLLHQMRFAAWHGDAGEVARLARLVADEVAWECRWRSDNGLAVALNRYLEAKAEAERTQRVCDRWTEAHGISVWREGHPADRQKLHERRMARRALRFEQRALQDAMRACPTAGAA